MSNLTPRQMLGIFAAGIFVIVSPDKVIDKQIEDRERTRVETIVSARPPALPVIEKRTPVGRGASFRVGPSEDRAPYRIETLEPGAHMFVVLDSASRVKFRWSEADNGEYGWTRREETEPLRAFTERERAEAKAGAEKALAKMRKRVDEMEGITWYYDPSTPRSDNTRNIHLYIGQKDQAWLRLRIRYSGDDWLFIRRYRIKADEQVFDIQPSLRDVERDNGGGEIREWYDTPPAKKSSKWYARWWPPRRPRSATKEISTTTIARSPNRRNGRSTTCSMPSQPSRRIEQC